MGNPDLVAAMKAKYPTLEAFDAAGSPGRVAMFCGVEHSDAWLYRQELEEAKKLADKSEQESATREEVERFWEDSPGPQLDFLVEKDKQSKAIDLAMQLVAQVTEDVHMLLQANQEVTMGKVRQYFTKAIVTAEQRIHDTEDVVVKSAEQLRLTILRDIECGVVAVLNGKVNG